MLGGGSRYVPTFLLGWVFSCFRLAGLDSVSLGRFFLVLLLVVVLLPLATRPLFVTFLQVFFFFEFPFFMTFLMP